MHRDIEVSVLRQAREEFMELLYKTPNTKENEWQRFFSERPYVLSHSLPVALSHRDVSPRGRPGKSEADFVFYPSQSNPFTYGVVELKRPGTKILTLPRENIVRLSSEASTAVSQSKLYASQLERELLCHPARSLIIGNKAHMFIILGLSNEVSDKITHDVFKQQYDELMPKGIQLIPYDILLNCFSSNIPPSIYFLFPESSSPPPIVFYDRKGLLAIDYRGGGSPSLHAQFTNNGLQGIKIESFPQSYMKLKMHGVCPYCGELNGAKCISKNLFTVATKPLASFFSGRDGDSMYRLMECTKTRGSLQFKEYYDVIQVKTWFKNLRKGVCCRCGGEDVDHNDDSTDITGPVTRIQKWVCRTCGFWDEYHSWGPLSRGA